AAKDEYEKTKGKYLVELQLLEEKLKNFSEDLTRTQQKYERFLNNKEIELNKLKQEEVETIQYYLNKLIKENKINNRLKTTEEEKQNLVHELDQLKSENNNVITEIDAYAAEEKLNNLKERIANLESEIQEHTRQYNVYSEKIAELKAELNKRLDLESDLRQND